ncbi:Fructosamine kinase-domain-containing protein [Microdochium trichocladiopsis]|uniref:protein-ribulosamine 3-kinase n=1 Tax=Microdochium trichocladiopsis TaxID=1682393 RepID=A0A9P8XZQ4_9PEZI|nr:Fructosamine kinase-domain-containing protein [Microdochium trichocladiopsis]KAH7021504.1 Fructosamine kinase-domain-containing protein [Microdochium trichocladiopsis]
MEYEILDEAIIRALPAGCDVLSVVPHGKTRWSVGLRVDVQVPSIDQGDDDEDDEDDDSEQQFFLKIIERREWLAMAEAEFEGQKALTQYIPDNVVAPLAWGLLDSDPSKSFFLTKFRNLRARCPPLAPFLAILKKLHQTSTSPTGKFGFHVPTFFGPPPMINDWTESWEHYYARQFASDVSLVQHVHGIDAELQALTEQFMDKVIARLLRPLQTGGRRIRPVLCHGDLWDGNVQIDVDTQQPIIFDAVCFYGHNEIDLQCMGDARYVLGMDFVDMYKDEVGASEPQRDFYDRHKMYRMSKDDMRALLQKYPNGYADFVDDVAAAGLVE